MNISVHISFVMFLISRATHKPNFSSVSMWKVKQISNLFLPPGIFFSAAMLKGFSRALKRIPQSTSSAWQYREEMLLCSET